jgi:hypothetical protein
VAVRMPEDIRLALDDGGGHQDFKLAIGEGNHGALDNAAAVTFEQSPWGQRTLVLSR